MEEIQKFLHGTVEVTIFDATPYISTFPFNCLFLNGKPTYVTIKIGNKKVAKTSQEHDRVWNQTFQILCAHPLDSIITITMKTKCSILGKFHIQADKIVKEATFINGFFPLIMETGKPNPELKLRFMLWFKPAQLEPTWRKIISNGQSQGLRNATFPQRSNCHVTLYQDAHHLNTFQPPLALCGSPRKLWEDVYKAIDGAKLLIYIAGWSFNPKMVLVRDSETDIPHARGLKLGDLLKRKAEEGVAVRIMIWDDETSLPIIKNKGVMGTHDEDAFAYFKHTKVICKLCPRLHNKFPTFFAHHQKTITVDTRANDSINDREIMSFIGGLDLCDGRFDTEQHSLFQTLNAESHCGDFYQTNIAGANLQKGGPREPWHDAHACIVGEAAWDVLANFEQRWTKQCDPSLLISTSSISNLRHQPYNPVSSSISNGRNWKVQVYRSIDHVSASKMARNLTSERSIHEAYVEAIRRAERFIYIENQYFIGGCHLWDKDKHCGCRNLIPIEIALKIVSKIKAKERFAVYILMPMWPEGVPESEPVQDILHWTRETMAMMYKLIGEALQESGEPGHPRDYLNFFCLANREEASKGEFVPPYSPHQGTQYWNAQKNRRFMVYVHSKLMIVDDAYILIGSANVNQRSMDGKRDTEIAIGCYQQENGTEKASPRDIQAYRMSLWYEHTGLVEETLLQPQSLECVGKIYSLGEAMWKIYSGEEVTDMEGVHLVNYPINVTKDGLVEDIDDGNGNFPDTKTPVKGRRSKVLPCVFTT
ncbi:phospholipase D alpha 4 [Ricinus communis]|uniref:Phospholipase D n=1 Tax=Ricinus communis TaxID=3988 RepID=B9SN47_RICCO|nr:phospholipase D alpha 4 [Ricinus communis]EEF34982.1 phospholipase d, putative [Ricinus communis]|eukprot:XP_002527416.1 phospholipase D alpha 4 [Ricinus communis]